MSGVPLHVVVSAYESLAAGDQHEALAILGNAIEDGGKGPDSGHSLSPPVCPVCGVRAFPGEDWRHVWTVHQRAEARRAA